MRRPPHLDVDGPPARRWITPLVMSSTLDARSQISGGSMFHFLSRLKRSATHPTRPEKKRRAIRLAVEAFESRDVPSASAIAGGAAALRGPAQVGAAAPRPTPPSAPALAQ